MIEQIYSFLTSNTTTFTLQGWSMGWVDVVEIFIIAFLLYQIMIWMRNTKAWSLMKGMAIIVVFILIAVAFEMNTILWIVEHVLNLAITAVVVVLQPELRRALETLGKKKFFGGIFSFDRDMGERFSDKTLSELVRASFEMGKVKTGALIVIEQNVLLTEYENTGIAVDGIVTSQLLINIFEHNTPLHDGAVIVKGDRVASATCYLPLSDNKSISKELGTRHRAGMGVSEATDSMTIIVSEETGNVSVAYEGNLYRNLDANGLREKLMLIQNKSEEEKKHRRWKFK